MHYIYIARGPQSIYNIHSNRGKIGVHCHSTCGYGTQNNSVLMQHFIYILRGSESNDTLIEWTLSMTFPHNLTDMIKFHSNILFPLRREHIRGMVQCFYRGIHNGSPSKIVLLPRRGTKRVLFGRYSIFFIMTYQKF